MSDVNDDTVDDSLALLVRDHYIYADSLNKEYEIRIENSCNFMTGILTLSDVALIVECTNDLPVTKYCPIIVKIPEITETYLTEYFKRLYPNQSASFSNIFI